ncbi:bleomycin hydrolase isoform X1 [Octopus sinensis]|uniref:Bleomycin hydrolase n=1 Tax=Octopus sinensis TaxID=2607531 RepID=A0A7E6FT49_9MOLL|nr:bleomycin hydrolase isoform X1 [Octopus sinensis]
MMSFPFRCVCRLRRQCSQICKVCCRESSTRYKICNRIPQATLDKLRDEFIANDRLMFTQGVCNHVNINEISRCPRQLLDVNHVFNVKVEEAKPVTHQRASGRCWIFAALNQMRIPFMEKFEVPEFEFSQAYLFFWDKLERSNFILDAFIDCARNGNTAGSRVVDHLLVNASDDGGQWDMLVNLISKYGIVPKNIYPDTVSCEASRYLVSIISHKMREYCKILQENVVKGVTDADLQVLKEGMVKELYTILSVTLGTPPKEFVWDYYNKSKVYHSIGPISPHDFYHEHIKPVFDVSDMVCLVNDPRPSSLYNKTYTVEYLGNMTSGNPVIYINQPIEKLKHYALMQLQSKKSVWFGCDHSHQNQLKGIGCLDMRA